MQTSSIIAVLVTAATAAALLWIITTPRPGRSARRRHLPESTTLRIVGGGLVVAMAVIGVFGDSRLRTLALAALVWGALVVVVARIREKG